MNVPQKNKVEVMIGGQEYTLTGVEAYDYMQKVASYIDEKMEDITRMNCRLSTSDAAVLTAVNVADDFFKTNDQKDDNNRELQLFKDQGKALLEENRRIIAENSTLSNTNTGLQIELTKRYEAENNVQKEIKLLSDKIRLLVEEKEHLINENAFLTNSNTNLNLELAKCEEELLELRTSPEKLSKNGIKS